jgi:enamine deaminase RidA (YjgF/YER057c/UK114 family)
MTSSVEARLAELGHPLPPVVAPLAAYVPAVRSGQLVFTSGQLPLVDGALHAKGLVSDDTQDKVVDGWVIDQQVVDIETARECAAIAAVNAISALKTVVADLDQVARVVKVTGYVAAFPGFTAHPQVVNGASELLGHIWGEAGGHARAAVGVASLPLGAPVEIEITVELHDNG